MHFLASGYRTMGKRYAYQALRVLGVDFQEDESEPETVTFVPDERMTSIADAMKQPVAIVNESEKKAIYGIDFQNLGYAGYATAFDAANTGYLFKIQKATGGYLLHLITPEGYEYYCRRQESAYQVINGVIVT